ncbi:hypothetical protein [Streptomyces albireticuli]|uniref:Fe2OG dioxygenase domain-containing protein n=1 Tax=Streptomyces albireticuli TaxID=1940 RepID=A0A2A2DEH5_9ACTN|nr:hypothetical protein [Streptomyces albireticuli]MCD9194718.1 hypothetical protein [Streptomyces albireticuli]PAU49925.1 hypothetical protein CK936_05155 [Streptomyces albireticuli]
MIHVSETFALHTVEDFLTAEEISQLNKIMDSEPAAASGPANAFRYEAAPRAAQAILQQAAERALPAIRRLMPSLAATARWMYTELGPGDAVPVHLDGIPDAGPPPRRIGRIGVDIARAGQGGQFYVATSSSPGLWTGDVRGEADGFLPGTPVTRSLPHADATVPASGDEPSWVETLPKTCWVTDAPAGVAFAYGAQLMHGVTPVTRGTLRKFVTDLLDGTPT